MTNSPGLFYFIFVIAFINVAGAFFSQRRAAAARNDTGKSRSDRFPVYDTSRPEGFTFHKLDRPRLISVKSSNFLGSRGASLVLLLTVIVYLSAAHLNRFETLLSSLQAFVR